MKAKYRSCISNETLAFKLRCTISVNYTWNFKDLLQKKRLHSISLINITFILLHIEIYCQCIRLNIIDYQNQLHLVLFTFINVNKRTLEHQKCFDYACGSHCISFQHCPRMQAKAGLGSPESRAETRVASLLFILERDTRKQKQGAGDTDKKKKSI